MLNLTGTEYRPELADGYRWKVYLSPTSSHVVLEVHAHVGGPPIYTSHVEITKEHTAEGIRLAVLEKSKSIAGMIRPWNPVYAPMALEALRSLQPPKDTQVRTSAEQVGDWNYGPRTSGALKLTTAAFGRDK